MPFDTSTSGELMDHVILTRFNLPSGGAESVVRAKDGWLRERIVLFERYCLPSVLAQRGGAPRWIIYFDPESPEWLLERTREHARAGHYTPILRAEVSRDELLDDIRSQFVTLGSELSTTNLDNDDALAGDFLSRLHSQPTPVRPTAYYLGNGLIKSPAGVFTRRDPLNAFPTVRSEWSNPVTCWADWHNHLDRHMPVVTLNGAPGWLQVVHGGNVTNRTRGRLVSPLPYRPSFPGMLDDAAVPTGADLARDRLLDGPRRELRDLTRQGAKLVAMKVLGRGGFERAKHVMATRRSRSTV